MKNDHRHRGVCVAKNWTKNQAKARKGKKRNKEFTTKCLGSGPVRLSLHTVGELEVRWGT